MMKRVEGKVCVVTGGARGIGLAAAEALLGEGARVLITDLDRQAGEAEAARLRGLGAEAWFMAQDVSHAKGWQPVMDEAVRCWGALDVLVNNAGIGALADVETESFDHWQATLSVNLSGVYLGTQAAIAQMKGRGGSIVNIASIEGLLGDAYLPAYNASKGGVRLFTKSAAIHCARAGYGIRINSVCPGFADTQLVSNAVALLPPEQAQAFAEKTLARIPMGRFARPEEIARTILFLASDESSYMTGSDLVVDGGMTA